MYKKVKEKNQHRIIIYPPTEINDYYVAEIPELPSCYAEGDSIEDVLKNIEENKENYIAELIDKDMPIPAPFTLEDFEIRIPVSPETRNRLISIARSLNLNMDDYVKKLINSASNKLPLIPEKNISSNLRSTTLTSWDNLNKIIDYAKAS